jgi:heptosyltransferase-2
MRSPRWDHVLVLQTSFLGDTVLTLPLLSEIKRRNPQARLTLLCTPAGRELVQDCTAIDEIIIDDKRGEHRGLGGLRRQALNLRSRGFSLALTPHKSLRSALLLYLARIPCRVGFRQSKGWFLFNRRIERRADLHDVDRSLSLLAAFGVSLEDCRRDYALRTTGSAQSAALAELNSHREGGKRLVIGINPGSVWPTKRWQAAGFAQVARLLKSQWDCEVIIFGGPDDVELAQEICSASGVDCLNYAARFTLKELAHALAVCDILITNDSGPMHIAVARRVPTVALFCATTPDLGFFPYSSNSIVLQKDLPCRPCSSHGGRRCPLATEDCIRLIRPEHVISAVEELLRPGRSEGVDGHRPKFVSV